MSIFVMILVLLDILSFGAMIGATIAGDDKVAAAISFFFVVFLFSLVSGAIGYGYAMNENKKNKK